MKQTCELTPMELFFCARVMKGKYLDYDYFRRTPDIQKHFQRHEQETLEQLDEKGIIELDFDGNAEMTPEYARLLEPVFFGEKESRLDVKNKPSRRFHIYSDRLVMSLIGEDSITFCEVTEEELSSYLEEEKVEICFSDVKKGRKNGVFTAKDIEKRENRELALKLLKGEL